MLLFYLKHSWKSKPILPILINCQISEKRENPELFTAVGTTENKLKEKQGKEPFFRS